MTATNTIQKVRCDFSNADLYNEIYIPLFANKAEFLHLYGSAGSGKSRFIAQKEIALSFDWRRRERKTLVIRKFGTTLKDSVYAEINRTISSWNLGAYFLPLKSPLSITNLITGVQFLFIGLDDVEKVKSITGVDRIWIEEATELTERKELEQLRLRLRGFAEIQTTLSYNPIDEYHWLNTDIHQTVSPSHFLLHTTFLDNEKLLASDPNYAASIERLKETNPNYYRVYGQGLWGRVVEGLIYEHYEVAPEFPKNQYGDDDIHSFGLDFGFTNPTALVALHLQDALPKKKLFIKELLYESSLDSELLIERFRTLSISKDVPIIGDSASPGLISSLHKAGYDIKGSEKFAGSVLSGINRLRGYELNITAGSKNAMKEIQNYRKKNVKGIWYEEPADRQPNHLLDASCYGSEIFVNEIVQDETDGILARALSSRGGIGGRRR